MDCDQSTNIPKARELLTKYEQERSHKQKMRFFTDAFDILDSCISDYTDSDVGFLAKKIKRTYLIRLLESLPKLSALDIDDWSEYFMVLFVKQSEEIEIICQEDGTLKGNYKNFISIWGKEVMAILKRLSGSGIKP